MTRLGGGVWSVRAVVWWFAVGLVPIERAAQENAPERDSETALRKRNRNRSDKTVPRHNVDSWVGVCISRLSSAEKKIL